MLARDKAFPCDVSATSSTLSAAAAAAATAVATVADVPGLTVGDALPGCNEKCCKCGDRAATKIINQNGSLHAPALLVTATGNRLLTDLLTSFFITVSVRPRTEGSEG